MILELPVLDTPIFAAEDGTHRLPIETAVTAACAVLVPQAVMESQAQEPCAAYLVFAGGGASDLAEDEVTHQSHLEAGPWLSA